MQWHRSHWARSVSMLYIIHICVIWITHTGRRPSTRQYISYHFGPFDASIYVGPHIHEHMLTCIGVCVCVCARMCMRTSMEWIDNPLHSVFFLAKINAHFTALAALASSVTYLCRSVSPFNALLTKIFGTAFCTVDILCGRRMEPRWESAMGTRTLW